MKLTIDTEHKTVHLEHDVNIDELSKMLKRLFPDSWKEWKLLAPVPYVHYYPMCDPGITIVTDCGTTVADPNPYGAQVVPLSIN